MLVNAVSGISPARIASWRARVCISSLVCATIIMQIVEIDFEQQPKNRSAFSTNFQRKKQHLEALLPLSLFFHFILSFFPSFFLFFLFFHIYIYLEFHFMYI